MARRSAATPSARRPVGTADFNGPAPTDGLTLDKTGNGYRLTASAPGQKAPADSGLLNVVGDLTVCSGAQCTGAPVTNAAGQSTTSGLAGNGLGGELLTTSFLTDALAAPAAAGCSTSTIGTGFDASVAGGAPNSSKPTLTVTLTVPAALLVPGRGAWQYDVCLGVKPYDGAAFSPWLTKRFATIFTRQPAVVDGAGLYWGVVPACFWGVFEPFWVSIPSTNPCIVSKTINASGLTIVLRKPWPWDGRGGIF